MNDQSWRGAQLTKPPLMRMFAIHSAALLTGSAGLLFVSTTTAYSALFGGLIFLVPQFYFARRVFRYSGARAAKEIARSFYRGEAEKFLLTVMLFGGVFTLVQPLETLTLFVAYIIMMVLNGLLALQLSK